MHTSGCEDTLSHGGSYPVGVDCYTPIGEDRSLCNHRLSERSFELFQVAGGGVDILWLTQDNGIAWFLPIHLMPDLNIRVSNIATEVPRK